jgi:DNA-binding GntR family transcriptional regulator
MPANFRPVDKRQPIRPQVYAALRDAIVHVSLRPGLLLSENDLAQQLGVSRTPVREALIQLSEEGLIEIFPQIGSCVSKLKITEIMEALFLRETLECAAARLAAKNMTPADIAKLQSIADAHKRALEANDRDAMLSLDEEFHRLIIERSGFPRVWRLVRSTRNHLFRLRYLAIPQHGTSTESVRYHREIVDGLASGNPDLAERSMRAHQEWNFAYTQDLMRTLPEYFEGNIDEYLSNPAPWSTSAASA